MRLRFDGQTRRLIYFFIALVAVFVMGSLLPKASSYRIPKEIDLAYSYEMPRMDPPYPSSSHQSHIARAEALESGGARLAEPPELKFAKQEGSKVGKKKTSKKDAKKKKTKKTAKQLQKEKRERLAKARAYWAARRRAKAQIAREEIRKRQAEAQAERNARAAYNASNVVYVPTLPPKEVVEESLPPREEEDLDPSTWQARLQTQPDGPTIQKFMKARADGKIDDASFYRIVLVLLQDAASDRQRAGLAILETDQSEKTFQFIVLRSREFRPEVQQELQRLQGSYAQAHRLPILGRVLMIESNSTVVMAALNIIEKAFSGSRRGNPNQPGRQSRPVRLSQLSYFLGPLRKVSEGSDAAAASKAKSLIAQLETVASATP